MNNANNTKPNAITVLFFFVMAPVILTAPLWFPVMWIADRIKK